ncbi:MAG: hypothetical protein AABY53_01855 [Bdellovibrionota bacterium]
MNLAVDYFSKKHFFEENFQENNFKNEKSAEILIFTGVFRRPHVNNDPVNFIDPSGLFIPQVAVVIGGAIAGALAGVGAVLGGARLVVGGVTAVVDLLYAALTAIDSVPGSTPVQNVSNGINTTLNPNNNNPPNATPGCD